MKSEATCPPLPPTSTLFVPGGSPETIDDPGARVANSTFPLAPRSGLRNVIIASVMNAAVGDCGCVSAEVICWVGAGGGSAGSLTFASLASASISRC